MTVTRDVADPGSAFIDRARRFLIREYLPKIEHCLTELTDEQIWWRPNDESNSIGNLVLHLCGNARQWIVAALGGVMDKRDRDREFAQREIISSGALVEHLQETLTEVDGVLAGIDPDTLFDRKTIQGSDVDILEAIFHVTEHFSMHTGQIIMLTKLLKNKDMKFYDFSNGSPKSFVK